MKKKKSFTLYFFFLLLVLLPINVEAFGGSYRYDINKVSISEKILSLHGWAVINDNNNNSMHNVNPKYTLKLIGKNNKNQKIKESKVYDNLDDQFKPSHQNPYDYPRDYTKAFYTIPSSGTYAKQMYPTSGKGERADMVKATGNHFYINTDFFFVIPIQDIKDLLKVNQVERIYFELTVEVPKGNITVFGKSFSVPNSGKRVINLAIQQSRVDEIASHPELKNLEFMDKAEKITVAAGSAYVQSNRSAFIGPNSDRKVKYWSQPAGKFVALNESTLELLGRVRGKDYEMLYYTQHGNYQIVNGDRFMMDVYGNGNQSSLYGYYYYEVRTSMKQNSSFVSDSGSMTTYIPALWGLPEEGKATYLRMVEPACIDRNECKFSNIDKLNNTCPTQTLECCSLCTDSKTRDIYRNTLFCKSISKCGTCQTTPECTLDEAKKGGSKCPTSCCSLCNNPAYAKTDYCINPSKCGSPVNACFTNPACELSKLGPDSKCPVYNKTDPMKNDCCKTICSDNKYKNTYYCTDICQKPTSPPTTGQCDTITDPQEKYCCVYPNDSICDTYKEKDPDYDPSDPTASNTKGGLCLKPNEVKITFKYPQSGYGKQVFSNDACNISCQEIQEYTFPKKPTLRAGMGFEYPITSNGTRYCTAEYKNDTWSARVRQKAEAANTSYSNMISELDEAKRLDSICGPLDYETEPNNCTGDYRLSGGMCKREEPHHNACTLGGSYDSHRDICVRSNPDKRIPVPTEFDPETNTTTCPAIEENGECVRYEPQPPTEYSPTRCTSGTDIGSQCQFTKPACDNEFDLDGTICKRPVCEKSRVYWPTAQNKIGEHITKARGHLSTYSTSSRDYNLLIDDRYKCDTFTDHEYGGPTRIEVAYNEPNKTQVSNQTKYVRPPSVDSTSAMIGRNKTTKYDIYERYNRPNINYSFVGYYSGSANQFNVVSYRGFNKTTANYVDFWNEEAKAEMKLEFSKLYYVQRYTGELSVSNSSGYDEGGRFVYTDFYQNTGNYQYELKAVNVGPNFPFTNSNILSIDPFICSYEVTNLIFPPKGDINYNKYGNVGFEFRQISLTDPFPNRAPRENWKDHKDEITNNGYNIYKRQPMYNFILTPQIMKEIKNYNLRNSYDSFNAANPYKSKFLNDMQIKHLIR